MYVKKMFILETTKTQPALIITVRKVFSPQQPAEGSTTLTHHHLTLIQQQNQPNLPFVKLLAAEKQRRVDANELNESFKDHL